MVLMLTVSIKCVKFDWVCKVKNHNLTFLGASQEICIFQYLRFYKMNLINATPSYKCNKF